MAEKYSRPLTTESRAKLIDFFEAFLASVVVETVDGRADVAKAKAIEVLQTDIDILVFVTTIGMYHSPPLIKMVQMLLSNKRPAREIAEIVVGLAEEAFAIDRALRETVN